MQENLFELWNLFYYIIVGVILPILQQFIILEFAIGILILIYIRYAFSKTADFIVYFRKGEVEIFESQENTTAVYGLSTTKKEPLVFLKSKDVSPVVMRGFGKISRLWITIEGCAYVINMNKLQDILKKTIDEEFFALFRRKELPRIIAEVLKAKAKEFLIILIAGVMIGLVIGFGIVPVYLKFFEFIP